MLERREQDGAWMPERQDVERCTEIDVFDNDLETQQVELIYRQAPVAILTAWLLSAVVAAGLWSVAGHDSLVYWLVAQTLQTMSRLLLIWRYRQASEEVRKRPVWMLYFFIGTFIAGVTWGCIGVLFSFGWPVEYQMLTLITLAGVLAGAVSSYAVNMTVFVAFMVPAMLIPAQFMLVYSDRLQNNLGLMIMLFAGGLLVIARNYNRHAVHMLELRKMNAGLLEEMSSANRQLESEVAERRSVAASLRTEQQLFSSGPVVLFRWSSGEGWPIEYVSDTVEQFGYDAGDLVRRKVNFTELIHPADLQRVEESEFFSGRAGLPSVSLDYRILAADGTVRWVYDYTMPAYSETGELSHLHGYLLDITERKQAEFQLEQSRERAQVTLQSIADAVITTDANGQVEYMNPSAESLTGWDGMVARGLPISRVFALLPAGTRGGVDRGDKVDVLARCLLLGEVVKSQDDTEIVRQDGSRLSIRYSISPILTTPGSVLGAILVFHDMTRARTLERTISYQATHDALTGLWNRTEFEARLNEAIRAATRSGDSHVVCSIDIDQLKLINEICGHEEGDRLLCQVADLLRGSLRESDLVARLGGDEFGILMMKCTLVSATRVIEDLMVALRALRFTSGGRVFEVNASIGVAPVRPGSDSATHIMSEAELACHAAKEHGGKRYHIYQSNDADLQRRQSEMQWVSRISEAIDTDSLVLYCQEIRTLAGPQTGGLHMEVLVRMRDADGGIVTPDRFLPAAERYSLINSVDRWVVSHTLAWYAGYAESGRATEYDSVSINLSGLSLTDAKVLSHIKAEIRKYGVAPSTLCFEVTETAAVTNLSAATNFIRELRRQGCRFALDDFGSGLSSFAYLKNLPVDYLKIDGAFVRNMDTDEVDFAMVSAIQQLGKVLGTRTIAEFVRNDTILEMLRDMGVDYAQGYAIAKPAPLADIGVDVRQRIG
jgi:diguanylate cyclase (GGDEF)-like protein/PAS domain S-box-containing protein